MNGLCGPSQLTRLKLPMRIKTPASSNVLMYFWTKRLMNAGDMVWLHDVSGSTNPPGEFRRRLFFKFDACSHVIQFYFVQIVKKLP
jgi:hypothetical protein